MPQPRRGAVTIKDVAIRAKLSLATVSYALRDDPKIPEQTRGRVRAVAAALGYRPNPRVASLMAHIRRSQMRDVGERIAFVWMRTNRTQAARDPFLQRIFEGARLRAEQVGFALEEFWPTDPGMTERRLAQIIQARGIVGVVLSPVTTNEASITLDWDWQPFAPAVIGNVSWSPELHHAGHHHYIGMQMALQELQRLGCSRPVALIDSETNERAKRAWEASFLTHHPDRAKAPALVRLVTANDLTGAADWVRGSRPDALIVSATRLLSAPGLRKIARELGVPRVTLYRSNEPAAIGGIDQCYDRIAAHAVDLVIAQLNSNETGAPDLPRMMLFPGRWVPPKIGMKRS